MISLLSRPLSLVLFIDFHYMEGNFQYHYNGSGEKAAARQRESEREASEEEKKKVLFPPCTSRSGAREEASE
jgi:hypothetical protein